MNDKLHLWLNSQRDCYTHNDNFGSNFEFHFKEIRKPNEPPKMINPKHCYNAETLNVTELPTGLLIAINPNKVTGQPLGSHLPYDRLKKDCIEKIESELSGIGIDLNVPLGAAQIIRFDNSFDLFTSSEYERYEPIIKTLAPHGLRQAKTALWENTFYYGSKTNKITVYNKQAESNLDMPCLRLEFRHLKYAPKGQKIYLSDITETRYYKHRKSDKERIYKCLFDFEPKILQAMPVACLFDAVVNSVRNDQAYKTTSLNTVIASAAQNGINLIDLFKLDRKNPYYKRFNSVIRDLTTYRLFESTEMIDRFNELKTLLRGAA